MMELLPVFADQLSAALASLRQADRSKAVVLMMEVAAEADLVWHHRQKLVFLFSAMRHFAAQLHSIGWTVRYVRLDDPGNGGSFNAEIERAAAELKPERIVLTEPGEWRVEQMALGWRAATGIETTILPDSRFLCSRDEFARWAAGRKELRMEFFYREMRRKTGLLMDGTQPCGGEWNFDKENRKPPKRDLFLPKVPQFAPDDITRAVMAMVAKRFPDRFGDVAPFGYPVTTHQAEIAAADFIANRLPSFGDFQDAMLTGEDHLYHSVLAPAINVGLLDPLAICRAAENAYRAGKAPLNAVEGFIRQIIGWREYVRGVYWLKMPAYAEMNALAAHRPLPSFYWTGETKMNCIAKVVGQTRRTAYAHHIQRLMVTGNFALLAGIDPVAVHQWYLAVYADAFEWVELPNTLGMSQFADGGILGSKPYAASGAYINRMSDYCGKCRYDPAKRTGTDACPFNALYWDFLVRNKARLQENRRLAMPYATLAKMSPTDRADISARSIDVFEALEAGLL
jgi:deoxyribodipyrimidine photolyase-related protein